MANAASKKGKQSSKGTTGARSRSDNKKPTRSRGKGSQKQAGKDEAQPSAYDLRLSQLSREAVLFASVAAMLFLFAALLTYHPADPGWATNGNGTAVQNLLGTPGAWFADVFLSLFGYLGYVVPLLVMYGGWLVFSDKRPAPEDAPGSRSIRGASLLLCLISACGLASLLLGGADASRVPQESGGLFGALAAQPLAQLINPIGAGWALVTVLVITLSMGLGFSWLSVAERLGQWALGGALAVSGWAVDQWGAWQASRKKRAEQRAEAVTIADSEAPRASFRKSNSAGKTRRAPSLNAASNGQDVQGQSATTPWDAGGRNKPAKSTVIKNPDKDRKSQKNRKATKKATQKVAPTLSAETPAGVPTFNPATDSPIPPLSLLDPPPAPKNDHDEAHLQKLSDNLEQHLADFNVQARVVAVEPGPVVTRFEIDPAPGVKVNQITNLSKDLARSMSTSSVRVVEVIPGKSVVGLEVPNQVRDTVSLHEILDTDLYHRAEAPLTIGLGKDIGGNPVTANLNKMPHLLVAGTTGSGKSVAVNAMILSILHKATPDQVRLILIDPKMLELSVYDSIPHLLSPVVTDMKDAANALRWCVGEMERRYKLMAAMGVRNMAGFNAKVQQAIDDGQPIEDPLAKSGQSNEAAEAGEQVPTLEPMPAIVIVVDELADMMMVVGKKVEELIARIAQKARAAGLHMILATQRPSVDVITGLIKANIPTRIGFQVASKVDSRTILDQQGAESLLGHGDMLYLPPGSGFPDRVHGAFVDDHEVHKVVEYLKQTGQPDYVDDIFEGAAIDGESGGDDEDDAEADPLYDQAVAIVAKSRKASISYVQRRLRVGYNRSARLIEQMENAGIVSPAEGSGGRDVLVPPPPDDD